MRVEKRMCREGVRVEKTCEHRRSASGGVRVEKEFE